MSVRAGAGVCVDAGAAVGRHARSEAGEGCFAVDSERSKGAKGHEMVVRGGLWIYIGRLSE